MWSARLSPCLKHLLLHMSSAKCQIITCQLWITDTTITIDTTIVKPTNTKSPFINPSLPTLTFRERTNQEKKINSMKYYTQKQRQEILLNSLLTCLYVLSATHIMKKKIQVRHNLSKKLIIDKIMIGVTGGAPQKRVMISSAEMDFSWSRLLSRKSRCKKGKNANPMVTTFPSIW